MDLIESYIHHRDELPLLAEEDPSKDWSHLREDEKAKRLEEEKKAEEEAKKKNDEEEKKEADEFAKLDDLGKIQSKWRKRVMESHNKALERLAVKRLSKAQKTELFKKAIRYSYLKHEHLLAMTMNPVFELAKNFIVEGLSVRLDPYETATRKELQINIEPRVLYEPEHGTSNAMLPGGPFSQGQNFMS